MKAEKISSFITCPRFLGGHPSALLLAALALFALITSTSGELGVVTAQPNVGLSPEPWLQVSSAETKRRGGEEVEDIVLLPPRRLTSGPLPASQEITQSLSSSHLPPDGGRLPASSPLRGWPVTGEITQGFGCSPYYTGLVGPGCPAEAPWFHDGLDIGAAADAPVQAALTATVIFAGPDGSGPACGNYRGYGLAVVVDNRAGWQALYAHLTQVDVAAGQAVAPATVIGTVGQTGCVSGPHLHFGLRHDGQLVDPAEWQEE